MKIGYARVSSKTQNLEGQIEILEKVGCDKIFSEKMSGANADRPELKSAMEFMRSGDMLVVCKIDRLARSIFDLHKIANELQERGIGLKFIKEDIDFTTAAGKLMFTLLGAIAEFERDLINARAKEGMERAKREGKQLGRPSRPKQDIERALDLFKNRDSNGLSVKDIVKMTGVPRATIYAKAKEKASELVN